MSAKDFTTISKLGEGSFGTVQKVVRHKDGQSYAMKKVKIMGMKEKDKKNALNEVRLLASISHPNIVKYCEAFYDQNTLSLCTVMELAENGDLASRIKQKQRTRNRFYQYEIWRIGNDIFSGLEALHEKKVIHRDIKPANIFFSKNDTAKVGDMNVSVVMKSNLAYTQIGTPSYASPQIWNDQPYSYECDIWSLGCVLYEMCCLKKPFEADSLDKLYEKVKKCKYDSIPQIYSDELSKLVQSCLTFRRSRARNSELRSTFNLRIPPKQQIFSNEQEEQDNENPEMMDTIRFPVFSKQLSKCLPKSNYETEKIKAISKTNSTLQEEDEEQYKILSKFLKPKPGSILHLNKNGTIETTKSHRVLPVSGNFSAIQVGREGMRPRNSYLNQVPSFKRAIDLFSPRKLQEDEQFSIDSINLKRKRMRKAFYGQ